MHKSKGSVVSGLDAIKMNPAEVVKYIFLRVNPQKSIDYDYRDGMPIIADEFDRIERQYFTEERTEEDENTFRAYEISKNNMISEKMPVQVPYGHLVNLVQMTDNNQALMDILKRTGYLDDATDEDVEAIIKRADTARYWLAGGFADDKYRFSVSSTMPSVELTADEKQFLSALSEKMAVIDWNSEDIGKSISEVGGESPIGTKGAFKTLYRILIEKERGPRLGNFLASMDREFVLGRVKEASQ